MWVEYLPAKLMRTDTLNKSKQGKNSRLDLMNVHIDYNDEVERKQTDPSFLTRPHGLPAEVFFAKAQAQEDSTLPQECVGAGLL